jgi:5-methylthioadenosine/S-adenosylhomocysteine deaminase
MFKKHFYKTRVFIRRKHILYMVSNIAVINTWLLTVQDNKLGIIRDGCVRTQGDTITYVGKTVESEYTSADIVIDGVNHVTMPGLVNAHTHTGLTLLRGCAQDLPEIEWMKKALGPLARHMSKEDRVLGSKLGVLEGLKSGSTTFSEYTKDVSEIIDMVYNPFGVRVVATETINETVYKKGLTPKDVYEFDEDKGEEGIKRTEDLFKKYADNSMVTCLYGPQALDMVSLKTLKTIKELATQKKGKIHMHVAQGERERLQIKGRYGKNATTVKVLKEHGVLDEKLIAVHIHDTTEKERELLVKKGVSMVGCPSSIGMIDGVVPPVNHYTHLGGMAGLGTDQAPGPGTHNMFKEMRMASMLSKVQAKDPAVLPAWESLQMGTRKGALVLGMNTIGSLTPGKKADIITVDISRVNMVPVISKPFHNFVPNLVYSATGAEVDNVIIQGELVMHNTHFTKIDENKIIQEANKQAQKIVEKAEKDWKQEHSKFVEYIEKGWM